MINLGKIYTLICPKTNTVRYVGQTKQLGKKRYFQHKYQWTRSKKASRVNCWIKSLFNEDLFPIFEIIEENISDCELNKKEMDYIKLYKSVGAKLTNHQMDYNQPYSIFKQKGEWKEKRLTSLKTSKKWKERSKRHSEIMKIKHKDPLIKIGFKCFSKEQLRIISLNNIEKRGKAVESFDENGNTLEKFNSVKEAAKFYNIKDSTHIVKVCKGKSKSGITHGIKFRYS